MYNSINLLDLVDKGSLDQLLHKFTEVTGVASFIVDPEGRPLSDEHHWTRLCSDFCRSTPEGKRRCYESDRYGGEVSVQTGSRFIYECLNAGLIDCTSPIMVGNYHIATFMCGQVLHAPIDTRVAEQHARDIGIDDISGYLQALDSVPIVSEGKLNAIVELLENFTGIISELAWSKYLSSIHSSNYLDRLINRLSDCIVSIDSDGKISMVNDAFGRIVQTDKESVIGQPFSSYVLDDRIEGTVENYAEFLDSYCPDAQCRASMHVVDVNGKQIPVQGTFAREATADGESSYVAVLRDISEELEVAQLKEDLVGMMTHDLGTPVLSIQKAMRLLASRIAGPLNKNQEELITLALSTTQQVSGMVMDYLDIYRHENDKLRLYKEIVDMRFVVQESIRQSSLIAEEKRLRIIYDVPPEELHVMGDRARLIRVCLNLLGNAIKFSPAGGRIWVETKPDKGGSDGDAVRYVRTEITDEGPGIDEDHKECVFDKFCCIGLRDHNTRNGVGLGLAFCELTVSAHQGSIGVCSPVFERDCADGYGSMFHFSIPADVGIQFESIGMHF